MTLRELLKKVNEELAENMKKEVIYKGNYKYDAENGRKVISEYDIKNIINKYESIVGWINISNAVNMEFYGITFKLKRKKSGLKSSYDYREKLTYSEIVINEEFKDKLDIELKKLQEDNKNEIKQREQYEKTKSQSRINSFVEDLNRCGMSVSQFKEMLDKYELLSYIEQRMLFKEVKDIG